uniref:GB1/RHD3-type G domain-containing protein n=1 Tax=Angiostrongylus cantonensis TaxID=6313 RepID=A0A0K0DHU6_ANGCA
LINHNLLTPAEANTITNMFEELMKSAHTSADEGVRCTIVPVGRTRSGKSTLKEGPPIYILDADVGQSEFIPAGCMSLWKLTFIVVSFMYQQPCNSNLQVVSFVTDRQKIIYIRVPHFRKCQDFTNM